MLRFTLLLAFPTLAAAQTLPATHVFSGLDATSAHIRIERGGTSPYGPRFRSERHDRGRGVEYFPGLKLPGQKEAFKRYVPAIRVVRPAFRLPPQDLGIPDTHDVVFFAENRVVRFRVQLKSAGESLASRWTGQLKTYFDFLDRDGNGELNRYEAEFAFSNPGVVQMIQSGFAYQRPDDAAMTFADIDVDGDGRIKFDEFAAYYTPSAARVISVQANPIRDVYAEFLTNELFKLFDTDGDGRLSRAELTAIEKQFATLDTDEDECLSATEIVPTLFTRAITPSRTVDDPRQSPMTSFRAGAVPNTIIQSIMTRYDKNKNGVLDKSENPFAEEVFRALDKNGNGEISAPS